MDPETAQELVAIRARLAALVRNADREDVVQELAQIRARLRELAVQNEEVGDRLAVSLGLRRPPRTPDSDA